METITTYYSSFIRAAVLLWILICLFTTGCLAVPPSQSYENTLINYEPLIGMNISHLQGQTLAVDANQPWQKSNVHITPGTNLKILAMGKWSLAPLLNIWSGPEGLPGTWKEVPWINSNALMGRIGEQGKPFEIGPECELLATGEGTLYFAINDPFNGLQDNSGSMQVTVYTSKNSSSFPTKTQMGGPQASPLSPATTGNTLNPIPAEFGKRTALVIGNAQYQAGALKNPVNDAQDMATILETMGFDVTLTLNAGQEQMEHAINTFGRQLFHGGVGLFYYAGHGIQVDGENYLIPVNANIESETDARYKAVNIGQVLGKMGDARNGLNMVILDACRDNPFAKRFRSASRGLAVVSSSAVKGTLIAYATSPGNVASDGEALNGLYTKHLLKNIQTPGVPVEQVFKRVLQGVEHETNGKQSPWTSSSFSGDFYFIPPSH
ncbi:caspase family protein [uncultured Nitrospira sp.]|uniref:caspase family protein n=1 Tax=uncultured Nitrospira sp. TaxID=157176 RepID=UPI003140A079